MKIKMLILLIVFTVFGIIDAAYLTMEHYSNVIPPCTINRLLPIASDCGKVLSSAYSVVFGIPLAAFGVFQYSLLLIAIILAFYSYYIYRNVKK